MDVATVPVLLSDKGLRAAEEIFGRRNIQSGHPSRDDYERARSIIFESGWLDYDEVYVALYTLRLTGGKWLPRQEFQQDHGAPQSGTVQIDCVLDVSLNPDYYNKWLINEWVVADIIDFRLTMGRLLPGQSALVYVGFGCFMMSLRVSLGTGQQVYSAGGQSRRPADAVAMLQDYLAVSGIDDIKHRFAVSKLEFAALT